jgi:hypothetical protein
MQQLHQEVAGMALFLHRSHDMFLLPLSRCCCCCCQEPELLETLYVTQQLHQEAADLALKSALRHLVPHGGAAAAAAAARPEEAEVVKAISGLQAAAQKYTHVSW